THNLDLLLRLSGLEKHVKRHMKKEWYGRLRLGARSPLSLERSNGGKHHQNVTCFRRDFGENMNILEKFKPIVDEVEREHGPFLIFALFLREYPFEIWDVVVSATWLDADKLDSYDIIGDKMQPRFTDSEIIQISRIVLLHADDPAADY